MYLGSWIHLKNINKQQIQVILARWFHLLLLVELPHLILILKLDRYLSIIVN
jgi:hypothetical protein